MAMANYRLTPPLAGILHDELVYSLGARRRLAGHDQYKVVGMLGYAGYISTCHHMCKYGVIHKVHRNTARKRPIARDSRGHKIW